LEETRISYTLFKTVKELYRKILSYVKHGGLLSEGFEVTKGLRQGCCISPTLFKIYVEEALNIWKRKCSGMGYNVDNTTIYATICSRSGGDGPKLGRVGLYVPEAQRRIF
jgi:hypothetical protein